MKKVSIEFDNKVDENPIIDGFSENNNEEGESVSTDSPESLDNTEKGSEEYDENDYIISSATPFSMIVLKNEAEQDIATLFFIVESLSGKKYILYTSYLAEDEFELEFFDNIPFNVSNNFSSFRLCSNIITSSFPLFITDFEFTYDKKSDSKYNFSIKAKSVTNESVSSDIVEFKMVSDVFNCIKYIDNYVLEQDINNYELTKASIFAREKINPSEIIMVDRIDRVIALTQQTKIKKSETYILEFVVVAGEEKYTILSTFNFGVKFNKRKFKGMTAEKISDTFLRESDQYLQIFSEFCRFSNIDKDYLIIRGSNKDSDSKLFFIDSSSKLELETLISEY